MSNALYSSAEMLKSIMPQYFQSNMDDDDYTPLLSDNYNEGNLEFERLIPPQPHTQAFTAPAARNEQDAIFKWIYLAALLGMFCLINVDVPGAIPASIYKSIVESLGLISALLAVSIVCAVAWLWLLAYHAEKVILIMVFSVPASMLIGSSVSLGYSIKSAVMEETQYSFWISLSGMLTSLISAYYAWRKRGLIRVWTKIVQLSMDILRLNPSLFVLGGILMTAHLAFSALWLWLFSFIFLHNNVSGWVTIYYIFIYFWTSSIFQNMEKAVVAAVVGDWFFVRFNKEGDTTWQHLRHVMRSSFGSIILCSLILGIVHTVQFFVKYAKRVLFVNKVSNRFVTSCLDLVVQITETFSSYTLVYVGLTGDSFSQSALQCTRLFRRNLVMGLATSTLSRLLSLLGRVLVSGGVGMVVFWTQIDANSQGYEWVTALVAAVIPYYLMGVLTHVVESTTDATFLCYLFDLDNNSCHSEGAHHLFSGALR